MTPAGSLLTLGSAAPVSTSPLRPSTRARRARRARPRLVNERSDVRAPDIRRR
jgi:hypothetical protein